MHKSIEGALESAALLGPSGIGKTQSVRHVLSTINDQVIIHTHYDEKPVNETQVVWLRVECPHDASPRGLCISFFQKIDELLGTDYNKRYGESRPTVNSMIPGLVTVSRAHYLGLLVIDEVQNLFSRQTRTSDELRDFVVRIINDLGIPVLMVGTGLTADHFKSSFRVNRRCTGLQQPFWDRFRENSVEWQMFTDGLWRYLYVNKGTAELSPAMRHELFDLTQGIPDLVVKLFYLAQMHAINEGTEEITVDLLQNVTERCFAQNAQHLADLRANRPPKSEYKSESVWNQGFLPLNDVQNPVASAGKKAKQKLKNTPEATASSPDLGFISAAVENGVYDALKLSGNIHSSETGTPGAENAPK